MEGVHGKTVRKRLGQSSIAMPLDRYSSVAANMKRLTTDELDVAIADAAKRSA